MAGDGTDDGTLGVRLVPSQNKGDRHDGGADEDTHHKVHETEGQFKFFEDQGEDAHEKTESDDAVTRHTKDVLTRGVRLDVLAVHIVREQGGDGDLLGGASGYDGHEEHNGDRGSTTFTHQVGSDSGWHETSASFVGGDRQVEGDGGETHGGGEGEGDGEPNETAEEVTLGGGARLSRDGGLPVGLVDENGTEVTNNVDDTEDDTTFREHGQVRALLVLGDRTAVLGGAQARDALSASHIARSDGREEVIHFARGTETVSSVGGVHNVDEGDENTEDDGGVDVRCQKGRLQATSHGVRDNTNRNQETSNGGVHASKRIHRSGTTEHKH